MGGADRDSSARALGATQPCRGRRDRRRLRSWGTCWWWPGSADPGGLRLGSLLNRASSIQGLNPVPGGIGIVLGTLILALAICGALGWAGMVRRRPRTALGAVDGPGHRSRPRCRGNSRAHQRRDERHLVRPCRLRAAGCHLRGRGWRGESPPRAFALASAGVGGGLGRAHLLWLSCSVGNGGLGWHRVGRHPPLGRADRRCGRRHWRGLVARHGRTARPTLAASWLARRIGDHARPARCAREGAGGRHGQVGVQPGLGAGEFTPIESFTDAIDVTPVIEWSDQHQAAAQWIRERATGSDLIATNVTFSPLVPALTGKQTLASGILYQAPYGRPDAVATLLAARGAELGLHRWAFGRLRWRHCARPGSTGCGWTDSDSGRRTGCRSLRSSTPTVRSTSWHSAESCR